MKLKLVGLINFILCLIFLTEIKMALGEEKEVEVGEVVVTATRTEEKLEMTPASVSIVTKKDVEKRNIKTVDEALNTISGVFNRRGKGLLDTLAGVYLRGFPEQKRTLILMDGIPLNNPYNGMIREFGGFSPEDVERIEVVKGPFSSLYGGYAMGGVVNIITKMPEKRELVFKTSYGSGFDRGDALDDFRKVYLSYGNKFKDKLSLFLSYGYKSTDGFSTDLNVAGSRPPADITGWSYTTDREGNIRYLIGDKGDNRWWDDNITIKARYNFSENTRLNLSFMRTRYEYNYDEPHTYLWNATTGEKIWSYGNVRESSFLSGSGGGVQNFYNFSFETGFSLSKMKQFIGPIKVKLSFGLVDEEKSWYVQRDDKKATRSGGPGKVSNTPSEGYNTELQFTFPLFERHVLTLGGFFRYGWANIKEHELSNWKDEKSKTKLTYQSKGKEKIYALFIQDEIMILDNLTAYIGFRQDWWKTYDGYENQIGTQGYPKYYSSKSESSFSPKVAMVYKPFGKTTLRASVGKAFRPPTVYELYRTWTSGSDITYVKNPYLKPETTTSWDIGIEQDLWKGAKFKATYFENYMKDLIYRKSVDSQSQEYINAGKAESKGIEVEAEQKFGKGFRFFANFTYIDAKIKENDANPKTVGKRLTYVPQKMFNIGIEFKKGNFFASLTGRYMGKIYSEDDNRDKVNNVYGSYDPYFVVDAKLSYKLNKNISISLSGDNIFDRDYFYYYKTPGSSWFGELELRF